jgi:hypothetical protein
MDLALCPPCRLSRHLAEKRGNKTGTGTGKRSRSRRGVFINAYRGKTPWAGGRRTQSTALSALAAECRRQTGETREWQANPAGGLEDPDRVPHARALAPKERGAGGSGSAASTSGRIGTGSRKSHGAEEYIRRCASEASVRATGSLCHGINRISDISCSTQATTEGLATGGARADEEIAMQEPMPPRDV